MGAHILQANQDVLNTTSFYSRQPGRRHPGQDTGGWTLQIAKESLPSQSSGITPFS